MWGSLERNFTFPRDEGFLAEDFLKGGSVGGNNISHITSVSRLGMPVVLLDTLMEGGAYSPGDIDMESHTKRVTLII